MRIALLVIFAAGCSTAFPAPTPVGNLSPAPIGGGAAPTGGGLGPGGKGGGVGGAQTGGGNTGEPPSGSGGALIPTGSYDLSDLCKMLLGNDHIGPGNCSSDSSKFTLPDTSYILNDPNIDVCGISDGDIAYAVDECFAAACDGQLGLIDIAKTHDANAAMYVADAKDLCGSSGQSLGNVTCRFSDVWSCP